MASSLMGSTMPLVPSTERPPSIPSLGLKVRSASSLPLGSITSALKPPFTSKSSLSLASSEVIICLGTLFMAASPTCCQRPGLVTLPTPSPPSMIISSSSMGVTREHTGMPSVTSGSSPLSFITVQTAPCPSNLPVTSRSSLMPLGVSISTWDGMLPVITAIAAAFAAAAAHVPVVNPHLSLLLFLVT